MSRSVIARSWRPRTGAGPEAGAALTISGRRGAAADVAVFTLVAHAVNVRIHHEPAVVHSALPGFPASLRCRGSRLCPAWSVPAVYSGFSAAVQPTVRVVCEGRQLGRGDQLVSQATCPIAL